MKKRKDSNGDVIPLSERFNEKGFKVGELTGRNMYVERNEDGRVVVKRRTDRDKKRMQREFNNGELDVLILNKSASTGISLHASEKFSDQRQRSMIIAQPLSDINDYMQMIGRIDRTGQVHRGYYINLGLPVPAENRFLMMLSTKLKSLNANTTTSQDSESNEVEAPDLLNKYGSQVVVEYLKDNPEIYEKMGEPLKKGANGGGNVTSKDLDEYKAQEDDARKITGYVALLSTKEQEEFYNDVVRRYNELIKYLNDTGNNDLKITVMPLRAKTIERRVSSEGVEPNGSNPFAKNSYVEKVEMDVLRKPMKSDDVRKTIEKVNNGETPSDYMRHVIATINDEYDERLAVENERYEKDKQRLQENIAKYAEKINAQKKRTDEEKKSAIDTYIENGNSSTESTHKLNVNRIKDKHIMLKRLLNQFEVGKSYLVPYNLESQMFDYASPAIFCGYKTNKSKITASTTLAVFATLDGRRRVDVKLSQTEALQSIDSATNENWDAARSTTLDNWDTQIPTETRKEGYIMTGNILQSIADTQDERGGYPGQLISYTDIDGNVHDGILMPDRWNPTMMKNSGVPLISRMQQIKEFEPVTSHDGKVEINGSSWTNTYYLTVPKSKRDGGMFFDNDILLNAASGRFFYPYHGKLRADIPGGNIESVVNELTRLGVKVKGDINTSSAVPTEERLSEQPIEAVEVRESDETLYRLRREPAPK
ncbi:MAG: strawberry notch C-terminal domain-containing protein, partial [Alloprevotella sp.]